MSSIYIIAHHLSLYKFLFLLPLPPLSPSSIPSLSFSYPSLPSLFLSPLPFSSLYLSSPSPSLPLSPPDPFSLPSPLLALITNYQILAVSQTIPYGPITLQRGERF